MDKVRRIVHPKLTPFHFQIKTFYLSDVNYSTDKPSVSIVNTAIDRKYRRRMCLYQAQASKQVAQNVQMFSNVLHIIKINMLHTLYYVWKQLW